jgi:hypothetical protein
VLAVRQFHFVGFSSGLGLSVECESKPATVDHPGINESGSNFSGGAILGFTTGLKRLWRGIGRILDTIVTQIKELSLGAYSDYFWPIGLFSSSLGPSPTG